MTKQERQAAKSTKISDNEQLAQLGALNSGLTEAMMTAGRAYLDGMTALNGEMIAFVTQRLRQDMDLGQSVARCENWGEAASLQQDWARRAMQDYTAEVTKLMQLASRTTMQSMNPVMHQATASVSEWTRTTLQKGED